LRRLGLHLDITSTLNDIIQRAIARKLPFFQCFFADRKTGKIIKPDDHDVHNFLSMRRIYFNKLYVHSSYFINLASIDRRYHPLLSKELMLAQRLEFTHMVIHPGAVKKIEDKSAGIDAVVRIINYLLRKERSIQFLLENSAYGDLTIGSNIEDFQHLLAKLDQPDRIGFCIDTAHVHAAGYDILSCKGYEQFISLLERTIGLEKIKLIHLNGTQELCGSCVDMHSYIGDERAILSEGGLKRFVHDKRLINIPILTEPPAIAENDERRMLIKVNEWLSPKLQDQIMK
jgi:deoxyribonuclease-4